MRDLERSVKFYTRLGLKEVARGDHQKFGAGIYVLFRDNKSGQKLELNWYPEGSVHATSYTPGEGLDHIAFVVDDLASTYDDLLADGAEPTDINPASTNGWLAYVKDPDGNWIEIYRHDPAKTPTGSIPEGY